MDDEHELMENGFTNKKNFSVSIQQLTDLVDPKNAENLKKQFHNSQGLCGELFTDPANGITEESVPLRKQLFGDNKYPPPKMKSFLKFLYEALKERMVVLLLLAAIVTVGVGIYETISGEPNAWLEGAAIVAAIAIISGVNSVNDHRKQARFRMLNDTSKSLKSVKIIRDGSHKQVPTEELVVGDIMYISMGDVLPCDGVLIYSKYVKTDESSMTGESDQIVKELDPSREEYDPFLLSGTTVVDGSGRAVIIAVGDNCLQGKAMKGMRIEPPPTPLQIKLGLLAKRLAMIGLYAAALTLVALLTIFFIKSSYTDLLEGLVQVLLVGISIVVMAIPEGLPLAVTLSLAYATIHMLKDNNLVRHLSACETMGGATAICSDKTGTLTINKMKVVRSVVFNQSADTIPVDELSGNEFFTHLANNIMTNSEAYEATVKGKMQFIGSKTDVALLEWLLQSDQYDYKRARTENPILEMIPFSSERKRMTTVIEQPDGKPVRYTKGASEIVLELCSHYVDASGVQRIDDTFRKSMEDVIEEFAKESLRTICCAYKDEKDGEDEDGNMILLAIFGIEDPLRPSAASSVADCQRAGVVVRMVTGDNALTATSIAKQCGILPASSEQSSRIGTEGFSSGYLVVEGPAFRQMSDEERLDIIPKLRVLARSSPTDKLLLVKALQALGETVAVTGDGANDGPALKNSDVGFSMGIAGTEVAKEASDIVLLDDNFASIVKAISWGRAVYTGIQKFLMFQIAINVSAVMITMITAIEGTLETGLPTAALTTLQILMLNLISDSLAAMALSTDPPTSILLNRKPYKKTDHIITPDMWRMIVGQSIFQIAVGLLVYYIGPFIWGYDRGLRGTMVFNTFVYMALFNELNCRSIGRDYNIFRGITKNKFFFPLFFVGLVVQYPIITYLGIIFDTVPLNWWQWLVCIVLGLGSLVVGFFIRVIDRMFPE